MFVLARTSNPDSHQVQQAVTADGGAVAQAVIDEVAAATAGRPTLGSIGLVVGATRTWPPGSTWAASTARCWRPGWVRRGRPRRTCDVFNGVDGLVLPSYSREVLRHGPDVGRSRIGR